MGSLLAVAVHAANIHDTKSGILAARKACERYPSIRAFCADAGYRGTFVREAERELGRRVDISEKIRPHEWEKLPWRWVVERTTSDNGKEFARHEKIARELGVEFFFARPYRSCDRGANENMNGLVRQYLPKGTDFGNVTPEDVRKIEERLNNRPRKRLDYMTPKEYILHKFNILLR